MLTSLLFSVLAFVQCPAEIPHRSTRGFLPRRLYGASYPPREYTTNFGKLSSRNMLATDISHSTTVRKVCGSYGRVAGMIRDATLVLWATWRRQWFDSELMAVCSVASPRSQFILGRCSQVEVFRAIDLRSSLSHNTIILCKTKKLATYIEEQIQSFH